MRKMLAESHLDTQTQQDALKGALIVRAARPEGSVEVEISMKAGGLRATLLLSEWRINHCRATTSHRRIGRTPQFALGHHSSSRPLVAKC